MEEAVDQYLYWEEEVTIIEAVNSVSNHHSHSFLSSDPPGLSPPSSDPPLPPLSSLPIPSPLHPSFFLQSPKAEHTPPCETPGDLQDTVTDDSGVSDVTSSSAGDREEEEEGGTHSGGHVMQEQSRDLADTRSSSSERWAHVSFDLPSPSPRFQQVGVCLGLFHTNPYRP